MDENQDYQEEEQNDEEPEMTKGEKAGEIAKKTFEIGAPIAAAGIAALPIPGARIAAAILAGSAAISHSIQPSHQSHKINPSGSTHHIKLATLAAKAVAHKYKF
jgi:hypothetical protein